ncbi:hypothetical protein K438DRAFT_2120276 [Mycena galopus ATCC 62051]|nr:hypothetical protein K438DRAFT_2120276 [Mycena galopus ATCC 62051]
MTTCEPAVISWQYSSSIVPTSFLATVSDPFNNSIRNLTTAAAPPTFTWQAVNVPQGSYQMIGIFTSPSLADISHFFVSIGNDTSCLDSAVPSSSSAPKINHGAIAGGAIGGVFVVLGAMIFILHRRRSRAARAIPVAYPRHISPTPTGQVASTQVLSGGPPNASQTAIALKRPQEAMFLKLARMQEEMRVHERREGRDEETLDIPSRAEHAGASLLPVTRPDGEIGGGLAADGMGPPRDLAHQFRAMAQRVGLMEVQMQTHGISDEQPPEYM